MDAERNRETPCGRAVCELPDAFCGVPPMPHLSARSSGIPPNRRETEAEGVSESVRGLPAQMRPTWREALRDVFRPVCQSGAMGERSVMGWRRRAGGGKRDSAEKPILEALVGVGAEFWQIGGTGNPDLLIRFPRLRGPFYAGEVKTGKGKETKNQTGAFPIWRTPDDVLKAIGAIR